MTTRKQFKITYSTLGSPDPLLHTYYEEALQEARTNLGRTHRMYIDGQWVEAASAYSTYSPIDTNVHMGSFQDGTAADIDRAVTAARAAYPGWRATPWQDRVTLLRRAAEVISDRLFAIAAVDSLEVGKNRLEALGDVEEAADFIRTYCDVMQENHGFAVRQRAESRHHRNTSVLKPHGVWAVISPFNFPIAPVRRPHRRGVDRRQHGRAQARRGYPFRPDAAGAMLRGSGSAPGRHQFCHRSEGDGRALVDHPGVDGITFTGSYRVGMEIYAKVASGRRPRPVITEMGGKNPAIVARSANLDLAAEGVARAAFGLSGQKCSACSRVYVHADIKDAFAAKLAAQAEKIQIGDPTQQEYWMGPVINRRAYEAYQTHAAELRAQGRILTGGTTLDPHGFYVAPTVVADLPESHTLWKQELFLPIVLVTGFTDFEDALAKANDVDFGLTAGCYSEDPDEVAQFLDTIEAGVIYVNRHTSATTGAWPGYQPFGGWKGSSNTNKGAGGAYYLQQYMREQSQTIVRQSRGWEEDEERGELSE